MIPHRYTTYKTQSTVRRTAAIDPVLVLSCEQLTVLQNAFHRCASHSRIRYTYAQS